MTEIPAGPEEITLAWLQTIFPHGDTIIGCDHEMLSEGLTSWMIRIHLNTRESTMPSTVVVKIIKPTMPDYIFRVHGIAETQFYRQMTTQRLGILIPHCYFAACHPDQRRLVLVLEDLSAYQTGHVSEDSTPSPLLDAILGDLARLHVHSSRNTWNGLEWLEVTTGTLLMQTQTYDNRLPVLQQRLRDAWLHAFIDRYPSWQAFGRARSDQFRTGPGVSLIHGDVQLGNLFWDAAYRVRGWVDWAWVSRMKGAYDLALFFGLTMPTTVRQNHERTWLETYWADVQRLGGLAGYSWDHLLDDYRLALFYGGVRWLIALPMMVNWDHQADWATRVVNQVHSSWDDWEIEALLAGAND